MNTIAIKCIQRDIDEIKTNSKDSPIVFADPIDDDFFVIEAVISGPSSTTYENGIFLLSIKFSEQYPFNPPKSVIFKRAIMHPNVDEYGNFMSELLKPDTWLPSMTIKNILEHIWARLAIPDVDSNACDLTRAHLYKTDRERFETMAREYSLKYAAAT
ncbi:unnamed protein product [Adineta steineri]|uniref:UBC core domain-containing protein n=2 Tax=Adineta steineri TaxID=433720 RepID=A0A813QWR6_9BILA|nr:unnamed protein product [Adineta steineri]